MTSMRERQFYISRFLESIQSRPLSQIVIVKSNCKTEPPEFLTFSY